MAFEALGLLSIEGGEAADSVGGLLSAIHGLRGTWAPARRHPLPNPSPIKGEGLESALLNCGVVS